MKALKLKLTESVGVTVYFDNLITKEFKPFGAQEPINEIVTASLYTSEPHYFNNSEMDSLVFEDEANKKQYLISDMEQYDFHRLESSIATRITLSRQKAEFITADDAEGDTNEATEYHKREKEKKQKVSKYYPVVFLKKQASFQDKERVYHLVKDGITTPMVLDMRNPLILAGHLYTDIDTAKKVLNVIDGKSTEKVDKKLVTRAKFLLKTYEEWVTVIFSELKQRELLKPLNFVVLSKNSILPYEVIVEEKIIEPMISELVADGKLSFTKKKTYTEIDNFNDYMAAMAKLMTERIEAISKPIHTWGDIRPSTLSLSKQLRRKPFDAQLNAIEAALKSLKLKNNVSILAEPGTGKSLMTSSIAWMHAEENHKTMKLLILCPDHLVDSVWEEELEKTLNGVEIHHINSVSDLMEFEKAGYLDDKQHRAFILGQTDSKSGLDYRPSVNWVKYAKEFRCPCCGETVTHMAREYDEELKRYFRYEAPAPFDFFSSRNYRNETCKKCNTVLWEPINKTSLKKSLKSKKWVYSGVLKGFFPNDVRPVVEKVKELTAKLHKDGTTTKRKHSLKVEIEHFENLGEIIKGKKKEGIKRASNNAPVAMYIYKKLRYRFTHLILDEFHEYQGQSKRADACEMLIHSVKYAITGTGTGMNGYADSRFRTDYMLQPDKMKRAGFGIDDADKYQVAFGVIENRYRLVEKNGRKKRETLAPKKRPGISPVIFPLFMQDTTIFVSMDDFKHEMPNLDYLTLEVEMDDELKEAHKELMKEIRSKTSLDKKLFKSTVQVSYTFLDTPTVEKELFTKKGEFVLSTPTISKYQDNKMRKLIEVCDDRVNNQGRKMMIYTTYSADNINGYIAKNLKDEGFKVSILSPVDEHSISCDGTKVKVAKKQREYWIREEVAKGTNILVVNPELIQTGVNLLDFPTICYFQMGYKVYVNRQADLRSYRLGQTQDCEIIYLYYKDTVQEQVASLMATKIVASRAIEGRLDEDGLNAISADRTAEEELSAMFYGGMKGKVTLKRFEKSSTSAA